MAYVIVGLGNPGKEYEKTRHNAGRVAVELLAKREKFDDFIFNKKANARVAEGKVGKERVMLVLPETFVNKSGTAVAAFVKSKKAAEQLLVIHDDLDLPIGTIKMVFARGSGGHKGVESVMRALKTDAFARIRIGISAEGKRHMAKKVSGEEKVVKHVLGKFSPKEEPQAKKAIARAASAARAFVIDGLPAATQLANTR